MSAELTTVSPGVVRVSWTNELQEQGLRVSAEEVRRVVESAFKGGSTRVETHVDPDDEVLYPWRSFEAYPIFTNLAAGKSVTVPLHDDLTYDAHGLVAAVTPRTKLVFLSMPAQETINPSATVPSFPIVERYRYVWIWMGDPTLADPELVPDMHQMSSEQWAGDGMTIAADCNYQLILDNLMDLTHEEFVHSSSIGQDELSDSEFITTHEGNKVTVTRWMHNIDAPPFWLKNMRDKFPGFEGKVDRWQIIHFEAPATITIDVGVAKAGTGAPEGDRSQGVNGFVMNTITPETDRSSHYFWAFMRNYCLDSQLITTQLRDGVHGVFGEDEAMLKAQQKAIDANPDYEFYNLNIDAGGMWVRRILDGMLAAEANQSVRA